MHKGIIAYIAVIVVLVVLWYVLDGLRVPFSLAGSNSVTTTMGTTVPGRPVSTYTGQNFSCVGASVQERYANSTANATCSWGGGMMGMWTAAGQSRYGTATIRGQDGRTYASVRFYNQCSGLYEAYDLPAQNYTITVKSGPVNSSGYQTGCSMSSARLGSLPGAQGNTVYPNIINGGFDTGTYYGWNISGNAFGAGPLNITYANANNCYPEAAKWAGYNGTFFASTYACGYGSNSSGSMTSMPFVASGGFLNFQVLGSGYPASHVEIAYGNHTYITAFINTANMSKSRAGSFVFENATLPLLSVKGRPIQVRVIVNQSDPADFIAVGGFTLSGTPVQSHPWVLLNLTLYK